MTVAFELITPTITPPYPITSHHTSRLGFLGMGLTGLQRMSAIVESGLATVAAIADPMPEAVARAGQFVPQAIIVESLWDMLDLDLDGIVIATPGPMHALQAIAALEHGKSVFCHSPLARTAHEAARVVEVARTANRLLGVDSFYRFVGGTAQMQELIHSGALGCIYTVDLVFHDAYGPDKPWFYDPSMGGGGCLMDLGTHLVDLALWMLDFPTVQEVSTRLYAQGIPLHTPGVMSEDYATAQLDLDNGATVRLACSWHLPIGADAVIEATFYGTRGAVTLRNTNGSFYDFTVEHLQGKTRQPLSTLPDAWGERALVDWVQRLTRDGSYDVQAERLVDVAHVLDRIYGR